MFEEKDGVKGERRATQVPKPAGWSSWFGGQDVTIGPRIGPVLSSISLSDSDSDQSSTAILDKQIAAEDGHAIRYRTCSWQKVRSAEPCWRSPLLFGGDADGRHCCHL
jgi:hypothetical protein